MGRNAVTEWPALKTGQWKAEESKLTQLQRTSAVGFKAAAATSYA